MDPLETGLLTIAEFERLPDDGWQLELVRGRVVREPPSGFDHSEVGIRVASVLHRFVDEHGMGRVVGADAGFILFDDPPTVRAPDVAFVAENRLDFDRRRFAPFAPDLAVEILSPSNTASEIRQKVLDYLDAGTRLVWVLDPDSRTVTVYRSRQDIHLLTEEEDLDGGSVLPGFRVAVSKVLAG